MGKRWIKMLSYETRQSQMVMKVDMTGNVLCFIHQSSATCEVRVFRTCRTRRQIYS
jgi:hypothetical protein